MTTSADWNSLEVAKLAVSALTPLLVLVLTVVVNFRTKRLEQSWNEADRVAEKRVYLYDQIGIKANKIFCYVFFVGNWKETSPVDILALKRELDAAMHTYRPWFSDNFFRCYTEFIAASFAEYKELGSDAKIRSTLGDREARFPGPWNPEWNKMLLDEYETGRIRKAYDDLREGIATELRLRAPKLGGR